MAKKVRLDEQGVVVEIFTQLPPLHPSLADQFIDAPDTAEIGMCCSNNVFAFPEISAAENADLISAYCRRSILAVADEEDQRNGLKRAIRLERKERLGEGMSAEDLLEVESLIRLGEWIDEMRAACKSAINDGTAVDAVVWPGL